MPTPLVECIPNFSEARRPQVIEAILQAIQSIPEVRILDRHSDRDHNRTVITFIGPPEPVEEAAFRAIAKAAGLIDLNHQTGEHPRIGATDVVPFVPISDVSMADCIAMAQRLGKRVGDTLGIPVYLYEEAATRPERRNLENIRRGEYEALKEEIATLDERRPDFGPREVGPAGAVVIGARQPLIAFNVYLTSDDVSIAQKIARAIRNSSGGMHYVKAMGILVDGRAQVSMNLTNYRQSPIFRVVELIRREAARYGVAIHHSELVGLTPQEALIDSAVWYLQLDEFEPGQILEQRLFEIIGKAGQDQQGLRPSFLDDLASAQPTPAGGAAAAFTAAEGAALVAMVARTTIGKQQYAAVEEQMLALIEQADQLRKQLTAAAAEDSTAFEAYLSALRLPKNTPEQQEGRAQAVRQAALDATNAPIQVAKKAAHVAALAVEAARMGNAAAVADAAAAAALARSALTIAGLNARANLKLLKDPTIGTDLLEQLTLAEQGFAQQEQSLRTVLTERAGITIL